MEKVWIFGDSYSDPVSSLGQSSWTHDIAQRYAVKNFSHRGTGPDWSLNQLQLQLETAGDLTDVNMIFFVSDSYRFNFDFYQNPEHQALYWLIYKNSNLYEPYLNTHRKFCVQFYRHYISDINFLHRDTMKIIGCLRLYESVFKKILVWPVFYPARHAIAQTESFHYVSSALSSFENNNGYRYRQDPRANHLSPENHSVMFQQLCSWIDHGISIDTSEFVVKK